MPSIESVQLTPNKPGFYLKFGQTEWEVIERVPLAVAMRAGFHGFQTVMDSQCTVFYDQSTGDMYAQKSLKRPEPPSAEPTSPEEPADEEPKPDEPAEKADEPEEEPEPATRNASTLYRIAMRMVRPSINFTWGR